MNEELATTIKVMYSAFNHAIRGEDCALFLFELNDDDLTDADISTLYIVEVPANNSKNSSGA